MTLQARFQLFTTQLISSKKRLEGLETSIVANSAEKAIEKIFVLAEGLDPDAQRDLEGRHPKLRLLPCKERPDFSALIQTAYNYGHENMITIVCNSDIWFDLKQSDPDSLLGALRANHNLAFTLTRRQDLQPEQYLSVDGFLPEFLSSDAWIFAGKPRAFPCHGIFLGIQDMERLVHSTLQMEGYTLANACCWLRAIHLEASENNYSAYNRDWLQKTVLANPLLAARGLPQARVVLPAGHGLWDPRDPPHWDQFTPLWKDFINQWILVDGLQASYADCRLSLLWLLCLARNHNRYLIAYIDDETDPAIVHLLDRFHRLTGRSLCLKGFTFESMVQQAWRGDLCWASSPAVIGPELLMMELPLICLSCKEPRPIKRSWLHGQQPNTSLLSEQLQVLQLIDPSGAAKLALTSTNRAKTIWSVGLAAWMEWILHTAAHGMALLSSALRPKPGLPGRKDILATLSKRPGYILEIRDEPGYSLAKRVKRWLSWPTKGSKSALRR